MRVIRKDARADTNFESDLKLIRLASPTVQSEPSEDCYFEVSKALQEAIRVIEGSLKA